MASRKRFPDIGAQIKARRQELGLSLTGLARKLKSARSSICRLERGNNMRFSTLERVAEALDVEVSVTLKPVDRS
jgi:transcriptional regulator with XRE-family HTH domain